MKTILITALLLFSIPAAAQDREADARAAFEQGAAAFAEGRFEDALEAFERSYALFPAAEILYNLGSTSDRLQDEEAALGYFRAYVAESGDQGIEVRARIAALQRALARRRAAEEVPTSPQVSPPLPVVAQDPVPAPPAPRGPDHLRTILLGSAAVLVGAIAIGTSVAADSRYSGLRASCGQTPSGCSAGEIQEVSNLSTVANVSWAVAGGFTIAAGVSLAFDFGGGG